MPWNSALKSNLHWLFDAGIVGHLIVKEELTRTTMAAITAADLANSRRKKRGGQKLALDHFLVGYGFLGLGLSLAGLTFLAEKATTK